MNKDSRTLDDKGRNETDAIEGIRKEVFKWKEWINVARNDFESLRKSPNELKQDTSHFIVCSLYPRHLFLRSTLTCYLDVLSFGQKFSPYAHYGYFVINQFYTALF